MKLFSSRRALVVAVLAGALVAGLAGCKIQKQGDGGSKKVDIETPIGSMHVNTQVDPKDTGLAVFPGATRAEDDEEHKHAANLTMDSSLFGVKVVAVKFRSDDPPEKLVDFYRSQLKAYGDVTECHGNATIVHGRVSCLHTGSGYELVAGTEERHHAVKVQPDGKGSTFELVYIQTREEKETQ